MELKEKNCIVVIRKGYCIGSKHPLLIIWEKTDRFYISENATFLNAIKQLLRKKKKNFSKTSPKQISLKITLKYSEFAY